MTVKLSLISWISLIAGLVVGMLAQRSRMCFIGGWRDFFLIRDKYLLKGFFSFALTAALLFFVFHLAGSFLNNYPWFDRTPVSITMNEYVAQEFHDPEQNYDIPGSRNMNACELLMSPDLVIGRDLPIPGIDFGSYRIPTEVLLYLAAAFIIGLFSTLANGCPMRQHVMAGSGNLSSMLFLLGFYGAVLFYDKFLADFFNSLIAW